MSRHRNPELEWHRDQSYAARDIQRIQHNIRVACDQARARDAHRRAARPVQKRTGAITLILILAIGVVIGNAIAMGQAFAGVLA